MESELEGKWRSEETQGGEGCGGRKEGEGCGAVRRGGSVGRLVIKCRLHTDQYATINKT